MEKNDRENMDVEKRENRAVTESLTRIKGEAFCERTVLCIPRHFTRIGEEAFRENQRIERLEVPKIVTCIGERAFYGCSALKRVSLPGTLEKLGKGCFTPSRKTNQPHQLPA